MNFANISHKTPSSMQQYFRYLLFYVYLYYFKICYLFGFHDPKKYKHQNKSQQQRDAEYFEKKKTRFAQFTSNHMKNEKMDPLFYDKKAYDLYMQEQNTPLEKIWKSKLLLETTSRGNVIMYYDAYKMGFAYFSDQTSISYEVMNACAMKYVEIFRCYDFFIDEVALSQMNPDISSTVLALLAHYTPLKLTHMLSTNLKNKNENIRNKFLYMGKLSSGNCAILQKIQPENKKKLTPFQSTLLENIKKESSQTTGVSYRDFKRSSFFANFFS